MAYQPADLTWLAAGTPDRPKGVSVPLDDGLRRQVADALNAGVPTPTPTPTGTPARVSVGRQVWAKPSHGGAFENFDCPCPADEAGQPDLFGIQVLAPKRNVVIRNGRVARWSDGLCVEHTPGVLAGRLADWLIEGVTFADCHGLNPAQLFRGQGVYFAAGDRVTFRRCNFVGNGRARDKRVGVGNTTVLVGHGFSHGIYAQGGKVQYGMAQGCTAVWCDECVFAGNAAWGACNRSDGGRLTNNLLVGNAYGALVSGPWPCEARGNVVVPAPRPCEWYGGQRGGAGGLQLRAADVAVNDNLCVLPPENRMPDRNWRAPAYECNAGKRANKDDPTYQGPVRLTGGNNVALGWDDDVVNAGTAVPGLRIGPCPAADWAGFAARVEQQARAGTADAAALIAEARRMAGV